jgi:plasmid replication initiation protein
MENAILVHPADRAQPIELIGRDEMNLAEFPITLLTDRAPEGQKTLCYEDKHGKLTITGSDAYGLPTAADADVIVALLYLSKQKNNFTDPLVNFTRYELIKILGWQDIGKSYRRLTESLNRWATVSLRYQGTWWNNRSKRNVSVTMHILDSVVLYDRTEDNGQGSLLLSSFRWNQIFLESCQAGNLKRLDLDVYFSLKHPTSKRLYRFLDKRFHGKPSKPEYTFPLEEIAFTRVGLSQGYAGNAGKLKEKLQPAIDELEGRGFLEPMSRDERYLKEERKWIVRFVPKAEALALPAPEAAGQTPKLVTELIDRGVTAKTAAALIEQHPVELIEQQIDLFDWLISRQDKRLEKSPAGYLVKSIVDGYAVPKGYVSRAERQKREEAKQARERQAAEERRQKQQAEAREQAERDTVEAYIKQLTPAERAEHEAEALAQSSEESRQNYQNPALARYRETYMLYMLRDYVGKKLAEQNIAKV